MSSVEPPLPIELDQIRLVLASGSPRRHELLGLLGPSYHTLISDAEDRDDPVPSAVLAALPPFPLPHTTHPSLLAWRKASHAAVLSPHHTTVLGADTIVMIDGQVLNKPRDLHNAYQMLTQLSGRSHMVYTGLCVIQHESISLAHVMAGETLPISCSAHSYRIWFDLVVSEVEIAALSVDEINAYVATGEPLDKAGSYGIQGLGGRLVRAVRGSYTAVVGLPLAQTYRLLRAAGINGLSDPEQTYLHWLSTLGKEPLPCPPTLP
ncbi:Maf family protein [Candidatus Oscillochloris fontis]|uniref:Maf family protein n=1 Tax=Candidatus Oscillochloris fontis TaxID=2496868 RepID=UPI00158393A2|nr:Maf family protein [Candidatus Oscillochloris fontis]